MQSIEALTYLLYVDEFLQYHVLNLALIFVNLQYHSEAFALFRWQYLLHFDTNDCIVRLKNIHNRPTLISSLFNSPISAFPVNC
jgi:hypothetical protein